MRANVLAAILSTSFILGCGGNGFRGGSSDSASASAALDSSDSATTESAMLMTTTDGIDPASGQNDAASAGANGVTTWYQPAGCVSSATAGNVVTYTFADCTGPWGLVHVTGSAAVTYTAQADGIHAAIAANGLSVDGATLNLEADAVYSASGSSKQLVVASSGSGTGARGNQFTRKGNYTATWDTTSMCGGLDGAWSTTIDNDVWSTTMSGYRQCKSACPTAGTLAYTGGISKVTYTISFDGTAAAHWSTSNGFSGTAVLFCGG